MPQPSRASASGDAREALDKLYEAFERHYATSLDCDSIFDDRVVDAEEALQKAFFHYDHVLFEQTGMELPFDIVDDSDSEAIIDNYTSHRFSTNDDDFEDDDDEDFDSQNFEEYVFDTIDDVDDVDDEA